jgi:hypothetical protein
MSFLCNESNCTPGIESRLLITSLRIPLIEAEMKAASLEIRARGI